MDSEGGTARIHCFALRPFLGNILARKPSRKIPTRMAISVNSTVGVVIAIPVLSSREAASAFGLGSCQETEARGLELVCVVDSVRLQFLPICARRRSLFRSEPRRLLPLWEWVRHQRSAPAPSAE